MGRLTNIQFPAGEIPDNDLVLKTVAETSGLPLGLKKDVFGFILFVEHDPKKKFTSLEFIRHADEDRMEVTGFRLKKYYLLVAFVYAMRQLGGACPMELPSWAGKRWDDLFFKWLIPK
ncbi:hypothetical protein [Flavilitoribacter nigricans]|uniref:Uncharacterized protein n=1 Tax=Flavilitoribacter nigricans (strain ATCC 23147 / DSM 23189 / NBRC 102662 / NCIMB 1420 / SS-2) TaxID=1122177 RepID=A0A2D0N9J7_FLAN2|nr:hypothetical protein [Flavilitoribacter nigricans]PHN05046.1 hypothetical protein CRP01_18655 [Flavilitoribacter nigricans DSM 23189 = NBRC 102662]